MRHRKPSTLLIITLFILFFLSVLVLRLGYSVRLRAELTGRYLEGLTSFYIAKAALVLVTENLVQDKLASSFDYPYDEWRRQFENGGVPKRVDFSDTSGTVIGNYIVSIVDENSKLNINKASYTDLAMLAQRLKAQDVARVAKNIISYRDKKALKRFFSIHELLQAQEVAPEVFFGSDINDNGIADVWEENRSGAPTPGVKDFITVYSDGKININTAPFEVLMTIPEMTESAARALVSKRKEFPFESLDQTKDIPEVSQDIYNQIVSTGVVSSNYFKVGIVAQSNKAKTSRQIVAVIDRSGKEPKIIYYRQD